jgi:hypothetical protein
MRQQDVPAAYYSALVSVFLKDTRESILGALTVGAGNVDATQLIAWGREIDILKQTLGSYEGTIFLEFDVPRIGSRIDAVLIANGAVVVIEFLSLIGTRSGITRWT